MSLLQLQLIFAGLACALVYIVLSMMRKLGILNRLPKLPHLPKPKQIDLAPILHRMAKRRGKVEEEIVASPERLRRIKWSEPQAAQLDEDMVPVEPDHIAEFSRHFPAERFKQYKEDIEKRVELIFARVESGHISITEFEQRIRLDLAEVSRDRAELAEWERQADAPLEELNEAQNSVERAAEMLARCLEWANSFPEAVE